MNEGLRTCRAILIAIVCSLLMLAFVGFLFFFLTGDTEAQDCSFLEDDLISDVTVQYPNADHCDEQGRIQFICNQVVFTAYVDDHFLLAENFTGVVHDVHLVAGDTYRFTPAEATEWVEAWGTDGIVGVVDIYEQDCSDDVVYPPDNRTNWQQGDHYAITYLVGQNQDYLVVYLAMDGYGELTLAVDLRDFYGVACNVDESVCLYYLEETDEFQVNIIDYEGKLYETVWDATAHSGIGSAD